MTDHQPHGPPANMPTDVFEAGVVGECILCDGPVLGNLKTALRPLSHYVCAYQAATGLAASDRLKERVADMKANGQWPEGWNGSFGIEADREPWRDSDREPT